MNLQDFDISRRFQTTLRSAQRLTENAAADEVKELVFDVADPAFKCEVGQLIGVLIPGPHAFGHQQHFRLYTLAEIPEKSSNGVTRLVIVVKRCHYIDDHSGEEYPGIASNYLCDLRLGETLTLTGPYGYPFAMPKDREADILMIGMGTGIAPFRALVKHIYRDLGGWRGKVRLFYGARSGLEMLYMNDKRDDFANYYDEETFKAFQALSTRPHWSNATGLENVLAKNEHEVWEMVSAPDTCVYVAGVAVIRDALDRVFATMAGSKEKWQRRKAELVAGGRWVEIIY